MDEEQLARILYDALADQRVYVDDYQIRPEGTEWSAKYEVSVDGDVCFRAFARYVIERLKLKWIG